MRKLGFLAGAGLLTIALAAWAEESGHRDRLISGARVLAAHEAYLAYCADCHGEKGGGGSAEIDFTSPAAVALIAREDMIENTLRGHPLETSTTWSRALEEPEIVGIVDYIRDALMLPAPIADASLGRKTYARSCSVCHGERGNAASWAQNSLSSPPFDFTSDKAKALTRQRMIHSVTFGVRGTAMMPFATQFSRPQIVAVVDYIRGTFMPASAIAESEATRGVTTGEAAGGAGEHVHQVGEFVATEPFAHGLVGDYEAGKTFYEDNCSDCHGLKGDGEGRRAYFMARKPVNFTSEKARNELDRPHLYEAVSNGLKQSEMSAWSKVLDPQQIANVSEYVFRTFIIASPAGAAETPSWQPRSGHDEHSGGEHQGRGPAGDDRSGPGPAGDVQSSHQPAGDAHSKKKS
jgi:mono/diheme cytochrome c family protein